MSQFDGTGTDYVLEGPRVPTQCSRDGREPIPRLIRREDGQMVAGGAGETRHGVDAAIEPQTVLAHVPIFAGLSSGDLAHLVRYIRTRRYDRNDILFFEGDAGSALGVIAVG